MQEVLEWSLLCTCFDFFAVTCCFAGRLLWLVGMVTIRYIFCHYIASCDIVQQRKLFLEVGVALVHELALHHPLPISRIESAECSIAVLAHKLSKGNLPGRSSSQMKRVFVGENELRRPRVVAAPSVSQIASLESLNISSFSS